MKTKRKAYQESIQLFIDYKTPFRSDLIVHGICNIRRFQIHL